MKIKSILTDRTFEIQPYNKTGSHKSWTLKTTYDHLINTLGEPNATHLDDPYKVKASWGFRDEFGRKGFIWSYRVDDPTTCESWSCYGSKELLQEIFGHVFG